MAAVVSPPAANKGGSDGRRGAAPAASSTPSAGAAEKGSLGGGPPGVSGPRHEQQRQLSPAIDLSPLRLLAQRSLLKLLDQITEPKTLLLDAALAGPLGLVCDVGSLRTHGVERMFWLEEPRSASPQQQQQGRADDEDRLQDLVKDVHAPTRAVVYVCRPSLGLIRVISGHILHDRRNAASPTSLKHTYHALFSPRRSELALQLLSSLSTPSILSDLNLYDLGLELVPLEQDVLSLEEPSCWADVWARGDHGVIHRAVMSLMTVQHIYGAFPHIVGKGDMAQRLCSLLLRQRREYLSSDPTNPMLQSPSTQIDSLIIIDRSVDLASPLCTQLTYEGLIDEVVGIRSAHVEIDQSFVAEGRPESNVATPSGSTTPLQLSSRKTKKVRLDRVTDPLFGSVRDENFAIVGERLHTSAKQLNEDYEKRHNARTVAEMRAFVSQLGGLTKAHTSLRLHTGLTEKIMEYTTRDTFNTSLELQQNIVAGFDLAEQLASIEDLLLSEAPLSTVLRLLCLLSVVGGGIKPKSLEYLKREIVQTYGYQYLPLLNMLARTELLTRATPSSARSTVGFQAARGPLRLVVDDVDERDPNDISYVYSGYAPLSIRLVQAVAQKDALLARSTGGAVRAPSQRAGVLPRAHAILGWRGFEDVVKCVPGAMFEETQHRFEGHEGVRTSLGRSNGVASGRNGHSKQDLQQDTATSWMPSLGSSGDATGPKAVSAASVQAAALPASSATATTTTTMVFFLGGVTYAEISALRFMSQQTRNRRFVVATTNIISGDVMIETLQHPQSQ